MKFTEEKLEKAFAELPAGGLSIDFSLNKTNVSSRM